MNLFTYDQIMALSERERQIYHYVSAHAPETAQMSARELCKTVGVSTATLFRFCEKVGCNGLQELKYKITRAIEAEAQTSLRFPRDQALVYQFLKTVDEDREIEEKLQHAAQILAAARGIQFLGVGTSGSLGEYAARYFANMGIPAISLLDPFYPKATYDLTGQVLLALSVSGSTEQIITQVDGYKGHNGRIISITNEPDCELAHLSDVNLNYYMPMLFPPSYLGPHNITTQLPVLYYIETLARRVYTLLNP